MGDSGGALERIWDAYCSFRSCERVRSRPQMKKRAPIRVRAAMQPMAMPAISPEERLELEANCGGAVGVVVGGEVCVLDERAVVDVDVAVDAAVVEEVIVGTCSDGKPSPGLNANVEFSAYACCVSKVWFASLRV